MEYVYKRRVAQAIAGLLRGEIIVAEFDQDGVDGLMGRAEFVGELHNLD